MENVINKMTSSFQSFGHNDNFKGDVFNHFFYDALQVFDTHIFIIYYTHCRVWVDPVRWRDVTAVVLVRQWVARLHRSGFGCLCRKTDGWSFGVWSTFRRRHCHRSCCPPMWPRVTTTRMLHNSWIGTIEMNKNDNSTIKFEIILYYDFPSINGKHPNVRQKKWNQQS